MHALSLFSQNPARTAGGHRGECALRRPGPDSSRWLTRAGHPRPCCPHCRRSARRRVPTFRAPAPAPASQEASSGEVSPGEERCRAGQSVGALEAAPAGFSAEAARVPLPSQSSPPRPPGGSITSSRSTSPSLRTAGEHLYCIGASRVQRCLCPMYASETRPTWSAPGWWSSCRRRTRRNVAYLRSFIRSG